MSNFFVPRFTRLHKSFSTAGIFLAEPAANATPRIFVPEGKSPTSIYNISVSLGPIEQAIYFVVSGLAMKANTTISPGTESFSSKTIGQLIFQDRDFTVAAGATPIPAIDTTYAELARCMRYKSDSRDVLRRIKHGLWNLSFTKRSETGTSFDCEAQLAEVMVLPSKKLRIAIDPWARLAMTDVRQAVTINLDEYFSLPTGHTRLLFAKLAATIQPGNSFKHNLKSLVHSIWGKEQSSAEVTSRVALIEKSMSAMVEMGWRFEVTGDCAIVTRPKKAET